MSIASEQETRISRAGAGAEVPRTLAGKIPAIALSNVNSFSRGGTRARAFAGGQRI